MESPATSEAPQRAEPLRPAIAGLLRTRPTFEAGIVALLLFAVVWTFLCGQRGFFPFRQSVVFDGAHRLLSGQVPFRDFVAPCGPVAFLLQAGLFAVLGVNSTAYLLGACLLNGLAVLLVFRILHLVFPHERRLAYVAGILTAVWFYPPSGTPWIDQVAFFFVVTAIWAILTALCGRARHRLVALWFAGVSAALAILSRQGAGVLALPVYAVLLPLGGHASAGWWRRAAAFGGGLSGVLLLFTLWLFGFSDPTLFWQHGVEIPVRAAWQNLQSGWLDFLGSFVVGAGPIAVRVALVAAGGSALLVTALLLLGTLAGAKAAAAAWPPPILASGLLVYQYLFLIFSGVPVENGLPFLGLILVLGARSIALALVISRSAIAGLRFASMAAFLLVVAAGLHTAWSRKVHLIFARSDFPGRSSIAGFGAIRWGKPTRFFGVFDYEEEVVAGLVNELRRSQRRFFVFPDFTFLYGLVGRAAPQPLLWFEPDITHTEDHVAAIDDWIVRSLEENDVKIVLLEDASILGDIVTRLTRWPKLTSYLAGNFSPKERLGHFWVWIEKKDE